MSYPSATSTTSALSLYTAAKRNQSALQASQSNASVTSKKQQTATSSVTLNSIKEYLNAFNNTFGLNLVARQANHVHADTSPERQAKAMNFIQERKDYLDNDHIVAFINWFKADTAAADAYLAIKSEHGGLRRKWVEKQLKEVLGFPLL